MSVELRVDASLRVRDLASVLRRVLSRFRRKHAHLVSERHPLAGPRYARAQTFLSKHAIARIAIHFLSTHNAWRVATREQHGSGTGSAVRWRLRVSAAVEGRRLRHGCLVVGVVWVLRLL